jgi:hypothetical protein
MKEDEKIKQIIECIIPNIEKFKKTEENIILYQIKGCYFKDEERFKQQIEKTKKEDEKEEKELKNKYKKNHILQNIFPNTEIEVNEKNNKEEKFFINKKRYTEVTSEEANEILNSFNSGNKILIELNYGEKDVVLKKLFEKTKIKLQDNYTLDFITRLICYKQNLNSDFLNQIIFYTLDSDNITKKNWNNYNTILKTIVEYDKSHNFNQQINNSNLMKGANDCYYILNLYFEFLNNIEI